MNADTGTPGDEERDADADVESGMDVECDMIESCMKADADAECGMNADTGAPVDEERGMNAHADVERGMNVNWQLGIVVRRLVDDGLLAVRGKTLGDDSPKPKEIFFGDFFEDDYALSKWYADGTGDHQDAAAAAAASSAAAAGRAAAAAARSCAGRVLWADLAADDELGGEENVDYDHDVEDGAEVRGQQAEAMDTVPV